MAPRQQFQSTLIVNPELARLLVEARTRDISEQELREQRISFAFGNALDRDLITKETVRRSAQNGRLKG